MSEQPIIAVERLTRRFGDIVAVNRLDLQVQAGEIFGLVGPDGAGKTTTVRLMCGLLDATEGRAVVAGRDVAKDLNAVKDQIGYMAQRFGLYQDLTVEENMDFYADLFGVTGRDRGELKKSLLAMTRMEPFRGRSAGKLSGGMKQKLALMCTLLHHPRILFLDEPTNGVDPVSRRDFWAILYGLVKDGLTVFITTAYLDEAERCNRVGLIYRGELIRLDSPAALRTGMHDVCYEVAGPDLRAARPRLAREPGVVAVERSGPVLHVFVNPAANQPDWQGLSARRIVPSLEDVFIAEVRKREAAHAA